MGVFLELDSPTFDHTQHAGCFEICIDVESTDLLKVEPIGRIMKKTIGIMAVLAALLQPTFADFYSTTFGSGFANGGVIPDGSLVGIQDTRTLSGITFSSITDV